VVSGSTNHRYGPQATFPIFEFMGGTIFTRLREHEYFVAERTRTGNSRSWNSDLIRVRSLRGGAVPGLDLTTKMIDIKNLKAACRSKTLSLHKRRQARVPYALPSFRCQASTEDTRIGTSPCSRLMRFRRRRGARHSRQSHVDLNRFRST